MEHIIGYILAGVGLLVAVFCGRQALSGSGPTTKSVTNGLADSKASVDRLAVSEQQTASTIAEQGTSINNATNAVDDGISILQGIAKQNDSK